MREWWQLHQNRQGYRPANRFSLPPPPDESFESTKLHRYRLSLSRLFLTHNLMMGSKRPFLDMGSPVAAGDFNDRVDVNEPPAKKPKRDSKGKHKAKEGSIGWAKKRARTIERLFQHDQDLPADVRNDFEREVAAHKATIADRAFQKKRSAMISKYHMVRFFGTAPTFPALLN